ncbi:MAG: HEPN domain-containing protein [Candidatus Omnitrophica bacterium]|nr:HEPN domain-containing protein [Candidatus Omnitrophota bacterium]
MNRWKNWYEQGKRDFEKAKIDFNNIYYEWACFFRSTISRKSC